MKQKTDRINEMIEYYTELAHDITKVDKMMLLNDILTNLEELKKENENDRKNK